MTCPACSAATYPDDAYCGACGAALVTAEPASPSAGCQIVLRRGQPLLRFAAEWEFVVIADDGDILDRSAPFSANPGVLAADQPPPLDTGAWHAFHHLQQRLTAEGWTFVAAGQPWYQRRFTRERPATDCAQYWEHDVSASSGA